jgi:hypothetical protein
VFAQAGKAELDSFSLNLITFPLHFDRLEISLFCARVDLFSMAINDFFPLSLSFALRKALYGADNNNALGFFISHHTKLFSSSCSGFFLVFFRQMARVKHTLSRRVKSAPGLRLLRTMWLPFR